MLPADRWTGGAGFYDGVLPAQRPETRPRSWIVCRRPRGPSPHSNACAESHAVPVAVLSCCTIAPTVRIMLLTCGAKGTRTPDPLLANNRQHVHPRLPPQVSVRTGPWRSAGVRTCCGTFVLYSPPWSAAAQTPHGTPLRCRGQPRQAHGVNRSGSWDRHGSAGARYSPPLNLPPLPNR
jgi:hypothetical protein